MSRLMFCCLYPCACACALLSRVSIPLFGRYLIFSVISVPGGSPRGVSFRWYSIH